MTACPTIVVIEDSEVQALRLKHILEEQGSRVECVGSAEAAFNVLNDHRADLVMVDYHLPGMKGDEFCRQIRMNVATRDIPVLMLTEDTGEGVEKLGLESGADAYVSKAAETEMLLMRVNALLKKSSAGTSFHLEGSRNFRAARLLIVDDSRTFLEYLRLELGEEGYSIETAVNGKEALDLAQNQAFDCVVVDLIMPDMDGVEVCRRLEAIRKSAGNPMTILMLTSQDSNEDMMRGLAAGADDFVVKSADNAVLKARIRALLRRKFLMEENLRIFNEFERKELELAGMKAEKKAAEERARLSEQLAVVNKELEAFCYSVSHDLRGPLRSMDGFSQALLEDYGDKLDDTAQNYLKRVRMGSQRMAQLIDDLLGLSRINRAEMKRETFDLSAVARSVAEELRQAEPSRKVTFDIAGDLVAEGDKRLLRIALFNLLGNAWKYTSKHPKATISVGIGAGNGIKAFFVRDDGAGFDMTYAGKLFEPFQRLHTIHEFEGTGIGLATVQRIVSRHGGRVWADGVPEAGATFYFTLSPDGTAEETSWSDPS